MSVHNHLDTHKQVVIALIDGEFEYFATEGDAKEAGATEIVPCLLAYALWDEVVASRS